MTHLFGQALKFGSIGLMLLVSGILGASSTNQISMTSDNNDHH
ncbi:hypothetical protein ACPUEK_13375 [Marinomonas gallaica]